MKMGCWNGEHHLMLPDHVADWDATASWERERFASMRERLNPGMVLFDVGTEHGSLSAVYARWCKGMVLFEPNPTFWPNIRMTWEANHLPMPLGCFVGLVGDDSSDMGYDTPTNTDLTTIDYDGTMVDGWPACAWEDIETPAMAYRYLHNDKDVATTACTSLDQWVAQHHITPDAITIDVEGAELEVLMGTMNVLADHRPLVWVSVHPDLMERDYGATPELLNGWMDVCGYGGTHLGTDHEQHWLYEPR